MQLALNDGSSLPALGFGLYKVEPEATTDVVVAGVEAGYRLVDGIHPSPDGVQLMVSQILPTVDRFVVNLSRRRVASTHRGHRQGVILRE